MALPASSWLGRKRPRWREAPKPAQGSLNISFDQYSEGLIDFTTVLTAQQNLLTAENNLAVARGSIATSLAKTYRALGGGWQTVRNGNSFITPETREEMVNRTDWGDVLPPTGTQPQPGLPRPPASGTGLVSGRRNFKWVAASRSPKPKAQRFDMETSIAPLTNCQGSTIRFRTA